MDLDVKVIGAIGMGVTIAAIVLVMLIAKTYEKKN